MLIKESAILKSSSKKESQIWFHLYDSANGLPYMGTRATSVSLPPQAVIAQFRKAVKAECSNKLSSIDSDDLLVRKSESIFYHYRVVNFPDFQINIF